MSKSANHMFLNVVDIPFGINPLGPEKSLKQTILFKCGSFNPNMLGFTYSWNIDDIGEIGESGCGIVVNPAYADKSEEEICLICEIENPVTREDVQKYIDSYPCTSQKFKDTLWKIFEETTR